ncbi:MAG: phosphatidate cytidylyltransferase [Candidatus Heimdallarchaeota archaeon]|nr:MAG: phosphatidate cytidylyltransferase [Candidatus Heimdallarchaeota archaeon]
MDETLNQSTEEFKFLNELGRKSIHLSVWAIPLAYHLIMPAMNFSPEISLFIIQISLLGFLCFFVPLEVYRIKFNPNTWINHFTRATEKERPANYIFTAAVWLVLLLGVNFFYEMEVVELVLIATVMGDSAAALVGKGIGRVRLPLTKEKTVEGFIAGLLTNYVIGFCFLLFVWMNLSSSYQTWIILVLPLIPTIVWGLLDFFEDLPWYLADNLFNPPLATIIIALLEIFLSL